MRLRNLFDLWLDGAEFTDSVIPMWAVAADAVTGEEVVIASGKVADGVRASMSIPGAFNPWPHQGPLLIGGAVVNPMPASVLREAGSRHVIGSPVAGQDVVVERVTWSRRRTTGRGRGVPGKRSCGTCASPPPGIQVPSV